MALPISLNSYAFAPTNAALEQGLPIPLAAENQVASIAIQEQLPIILPEKFHLIIVPGFTPVNADKPAKITATTIKRLVKAVEVMRQKNIRFIMVSGGNVHPDNTPYNEAYGMKSYLKDKLDIKEEQIIMEPYALHSTTNLRNGGRFMLAHGLKRALIVTSFDQNFYFGFQGISTFASRSRKNLGYIIGQFGFLTPNTCSFIPSDAVMTRGDNPLDP